MEDRPFDELPRTDEGAPAEPPAGPPPPGDPGPEHAPRLGKLGMLAAGAAVVAVGLTLLLRDGGEGSDGLARVTVPGGSLVVLDVDESDRFPAGCGESKGKACFLVTQGAAGGGRHTDVVKAPNRMVVMRVDIEGADLAAVARDSFLATTDGQRLESVMWGYTSGDGGTALNAIIYAGPVVTRDVTLHLEGADPVRLKVGLLG